jgi:hypothetical protein
LKKCEQKGVLVIQNFSELTGVSFFSKQVFKFNHAQQSVHLTLGILRTSQAVFYAFSFFWLDGFAVPAPAQVTQTVRPLLAKFVSR